jgi:hypothetical protein
MVDRMPQPDRDRLSALTALVILIYALLRIVDLPEINLQTTILGLLISMNFNMPLVLLSLSAALTAAGADWIVRGHPNAMQGTRTAEHWIVPGLASLGIGAILSQLPTGATLWVGLPLAALLLIAVLIGEFIVFDPNDPRYDFARVGLRTLAYLLLVGTIFAIHAVNLRAFYLVPLTFVASVAVSWRLQRLEAIQPKRSLLYALMTGVLGAQAAWAFHYWPLSPLKVSLILALWVYLTHGWARSLEKQETGLGTIIELGLVAGVGLTAIIFLA